MTKIKYEVVPLKTESKEFRRKLAKLEKDVKQIGSEILKIKGMMGGNGY